MVGVDLEDRVRHLEDEPVNIIRLGPITISYGTAAPTTGSHARGDRCYNTMPSAGGTPGWVCTTAGIPGTWKAMANLAP